MSPYIPMYLFERWPSDLIYIIYDSFDDLSDKANFVHSTTYLTELLLDKLLEEYANVVKNRGPIQFIDYWGPVKCFYCFLEHVDDPFGSDDIYKCDICDTPFCAECDEGCDVCDINYCHNCVNSENMKKCDDCEAYTCPEHDGQCYC